MTTLENSYCVPKTVEEWDIFGLIPLTGHKVMWLGGEPSLVSGTFNDRTEIPVSHFFDLMHDRIVPWRLEEVGFSKSIMEIDGILFSIPYEQDYILKIGIVEVGVRIENDKFFAASLFIGDCAEQYFVLAHGVTTFTDLLTLIRMLTPPSND